MTLRLKGHAFEIQPEYEDGSDQFTLVFHYGGQFSHHPNPRYDGGDKCIYDYVEEHELSMLYLDQLCNGNGIYGQKEYYIIQDDGFLLVQRDRDLYKLCHECLAPRVVNLYVECSMIVDEDDDAGNDGENEGHSSSDSDYFEDKDYDYHMNEADDVEFAANVDEGYEYSGLHIGDDNRENEVEDDVSDDGSTDAACTEDELRSLHGSDSECEEADNLLFNPKRDMANPELVCGLRFTALSHFKEAVKNYSVKIGRPITICRSEKTRCSAKCNRPGCDWKVSVSLNKKIGKFEIRKMHSKHKCSCTIKNTSIRSGWIAKKYLSDFSNEPNPNIQNFRKKLTQELRCHVSKSQVYRTKAKALDIIRGGEAHEYALVWDYMEEIKKTDRSATILVKASSPNNEAIPEREGDSIIREANLPLVIDKPRFQRLYCCLSAMKTGMLSGCRKIFGIDGCHLKTRFGGMLLCAVGLDPNNNLFPIAHAAVEGETKDSWIWFLRNVKEDLNIDNDFDWTIISDKQKGLIQACDEVFPLAQHRFCVRHLHANWALAGYGNKMLKGALYEAACASTVVGFTVAMEKIVSLDPDAAKWLEDKPPSQWSRSHFTFHPKCDMLLNNVCESYNSRLRDAREMPVLSMFEWIRNYLMARFQENREKARMKWEGKKICPKVEKRLYKNMEDASNCIPSKADVGKFQCLQYDGLQFCVNLFERSCTCRKWDLNGIPCSHACAALSFDNLDPVDFVDECYSLKTYMQVYNLPIQPASGLKQLLPTGIEPLLPPLAKRKAGRPKKLRKKSKGEAELNRIQKEKNKPVHKMRRTGQIIICGICKKEGHNKRTCGDRIMSQQSVVQQDTQEHEHDQLSAAASAPTQLGVQNIRTKLKVRRAKTVGKTVETPTDATSPSRMRTISAEVQGEVGNREIKKRTRSVAAIGIEAGNNEKNGPPVSPTKRLTKSSTDVVNAHETSDVLGNSKGNARVTSSLPADVPNVWPYYRKVKDNPRPVPNFWNRNGKIFLPRSLIKEAMEVTKKKTKDHNEC